MIEYVASQISELMDVVLNFPWLEVQWNSLLYWITGGNRLTMYNCESL